MIRDAHDFRAGIHDRRMRKLTGRSYSALVQPVVRDFPIETMRPGDVSPCVTRVAIASSAFLSTLVSA